MKRKYIFPLLLSLMLGGLLCGCDTATDPPDETREHDHAAASWQTQTPPTCIETGSATGTCVECGVEMTIQLDKLPHTFTQEVVKPTCEAAGYTTYTCDCGYTYDGDPVKPLGHNLVGTVRRPTCESEGYNLYSCACGYSYKRKFVAPTGHTLKETVVAPTCEKAGYTTYSCDCGYTYTSDFVEPLGHTLKETVVAPTCEEAGYTTYTCDCGYTYTSDFVEPLGHTLKETVVAPTCEEAGYATYTCDCGFSYDGNYVVPTGHALTETVIPPTCTEAGYTLYACSNCEYEETGNTVAALHHMNMTYEFFYATISSDGYTLYDCPDCDYNRKENVVKYTDIVTGAYVDNTTVLKQGIDVSKWNHTYTMNGEEKVWKSLDWEALKAAGVDFVILKAGSTTGIDPVFEMNYAAAKAAGLEVGAYFYTYAITEEEALQDAETLIGWLDGKQFELPIYFDLEDPTQIDLGEEILMAMCKTFIERLQREGYYAALYTNKNWLYNLLDTEWIKANLDVWYARPVADKTDGSSSFTLADSDFAWDDGTASNPGETDKRYGLWQYTSYGQIEGFTGPFDFNYAFKNYRPIMEKWGLNGF